MSELNHRLAALMGAKIDEWVPNFDSSLDAMAPVERRIRDMGLFRKYIHAVRDLKSDPHEEMLTAPASIRAQAALAVMEAAK